MNKIPTSYFVGWWIPATRFTHAHTIEIKVFNTREKRENYVINRKRKWWEYLPFVEQFYYVN